MLEIKNLTKAYQKGEVKAVDNISLQVKKGEIFGFLGPNGAGKTTTIKMIAGLLKPDNGEILINKVNNFSSPIKAKKMISYVPDNPDIYKRLKGIEYINFMADMFDVKKEDRLKRIEKYATLFEMKDALNDPIGSYSHGMQQKIVLIASLVHDQELFILDEPMVGLDPKSAFNLKELMREMCNEGKCVFFSTHVLEVAEKFCDRIAIIKKGKLVAVGTLEELRKEEGVSSLEDIFLELTER